MPENPAVETSFIIIEPSCVQESALLVLPAPVVLTLPFALGVPFVLSYETTPAPFALLSAGLISTARHVLSIHPSGEALLSDNVLTWGKHPVGACVVILNASM